MNSFLVNKGMIRLKGVEDIRIQDPARHARVAAHQTIPMYNLIQLDTIQDT